MMSTIDFLKRSVGGRSDAAATTGSVQAKLAALVALVQGTTQVSVIRPSLAGPLVVVAAATAWTLGAWTQLVAASDLSGHNLIVLGLQYPGGNSGQYQIEIGTGGAGSEVVVWRTIWHRGVDQITYQLILPPVQIPANARVAVRSACDIVSENVQVYGIFLPRPS